MPYCGQSEREINGGNGREQCCTVAALTIDLAFDLDYKSATKWMFASSYGEFHRFLYLFSIPLDFGNLP